MLCGKISGSLGALNLKMLRMLCHGNIIGAISIGPKKTKSKQKKAKLNISCFTDRWTSFFFSFLRNNQ